MHGNLYDTFVPSSRICIAHSSAVAKDQCQDLFNESGELAEREQMKPNKTKGLKPNILKWSTRNQTEEC